MVDLCTTCENLDCDKYGYWCQALHNMKDEKCKDYDSKYKQLELNCEN